MFIVLFVNIFSYVSLELLTMSEESSRTHNYQKSKIMSAFDAVTFIYTP